MSLLRETPELTSAAGDHADGLQDESANAAATGPSD